MKRIISQLGVDLGTTRLRVALSETDGSKRRIAAVAVRDIAAGSSSSGEIPEPDYVAALLEETVAELGTRARRCICAIGEPDATLRSIVLPPMTAPERIRVARFEAQRYAAFPLDEAAVRIYPAGPHLPGVHALGIARAAALASRAGVLRAAGLKAIAMDHEACAFARLFGTFDAVVDVGHRRSSLHVFESGIPSTLHVDSGGAEITRGIERDLSIDERSAEKRKRILGTVGAGETARLQLAADIASLIETARNRRARLGHIALVGNGARLPGLAADIESATGAIVELPASDALRGAYPDDVLRASAPDWSLASGLALWGLAA